MLVLVGLILLVAWSAVAFILLSRRYENEQKVLAFQTIEEPAPKSIIRKPKPKPTTYIFEDIPPTEYPYKISILIPTRHRWGDLETAINSLRSTSRHQNGYEIIVRYDNDDNPPKEIEGVRYISGPSVKVHGAYGEMAYAAEGGILFLFNDNAIISKNDWDAELRAIFMNSDTEHTMAFTSDISAVSRSVFEKLGFLSRHSNPHSYLKDLQHQYDPKEVDTTEMQSDDRILQPSEFYDIVKQDGLYLRGLSDSLPSVSDMFERHVVGTTAR